jgi:hypothetical protein
MPVYGPNNGTVPFTGYTNTLGANPLSGNTSGSVANNSLTQQDDKIAYLFQRPGSRATRRLLITLLGAVAGTTATETRKRRQAIVAGGEFAQLGGIATIDTVNYVNRNTTAADTTAITALMNRTVAPASYPRDASGNGGGQPFWG